MRGAENGPAVTLLPVECDGNQNDVNSASPTSNRNGAGDGEDAGVGATTQSEQGGAVPEGQETVVGSGATTVPVTAAAPPYGGQAADQINQNVLKRNIRLIKNDCMTLLRQVERTIAQKQSEQIIQKAKYDELETEVSDRIALFSLCYSARRDSWEKICQSDSLLKSHSKHELTHVVEFRDLIM